MCEEGRGCSSIHAVYSGPRLNLHSFKVLGRVEDDVKEQSERPWRAYVTLRRQPDSKHDIFLNQVGVFVVLHHP